MRRPPQSIHDRHAQTFLGQRLGHDAIQSRVIELAQLAKEIRRRFAQIAVVLRRRDSTNVSENGASLQSNAP